MRYAYSSKPKRKTVHIINELTGKTLCEVEKEYRWIALDKRSHEKPLHKRLCGICSKLSGEEREPKKKKNKGEWLAAKRAREYCIRYFGLNEYATNVAIAYCISNELEVPMPEKDKEIKHFMIMFENKKIGLPVKIPSKWISAKEFYASKKWRELRYIALSNSEGKCNLCGASSKDGSSLHVDHIEPRSKAPNKAYDLDNLQVLCEDCNMGKSNYDSKDWR